MEETVEILKSDLDRTINYLNNLKQEWMWKSEEYMFGHREEFIYLKEFIEKLNATKEDS